jgi:CO/xanthine dehydrogenase FAD-binding subunit
MKPAAFEYFAPTTLADAVTLLARHGADAPLLAAARASFR